MNIRNKILKIIRPTRPPKNKAELLFFSMMLENGWDVIRRGWPDYACFKDGELIVVEVKKDRNIGLKQPQQQILESLSGYGIRSYRWDPVVGFTRITKQEKLLPTL